MTGILCLYFRLFAFSIASFRRAFISCTFSSIAFRGTYFQRRLISHYVVLHCHYSRVAIHSIIYSPTHVPNIPHFRTFCLFYLHLTTFDSHLYGDYAVTLHAHFHLLGKHLFSLHSTIPFRRRRPGLGGSSQRGQAASLACVAFWAAAASSSSQQLLLPAWQPSAQWPMASLVAMTGSGIDMTASSRQPAWRRRHDMALYCGWPVVMNSVSIGKEGLGRPSVFIQ